MKPENDDIMYELEQGIIDPRSKSLGWMSYDYFETQEEAQQAAGKTFPMDAIWRIRESRNVSVSRRYQQMQKESKP